MTDPIATLTEDEVRSWVSQNVPIDDFRGMTVLLLSLIHI